MLYWYYDREGEVSGHCNETVILCERCAQELGLHHDVASSLDYDDYPCCEWCDAIGLPGGRIPDDDDEQNVPHIRKLA